MIKRAALSGLAALLIGCTGCSTIPCKDKYNALIKSPALTEEQKAQIYVEECQEKGYDANLRIMKDFLGQYHVIAQIKYGDTTYFVSPQLNTHQTTLDDLRVDYLLDYIRQHKHEIRKRQMQEFPRRTKKQYL